MFKQGKTGLYLMAIVGVVAIFLIVLLSQRGLPSFDGDLAGDAKRALTQKNVPKASQTSEISPLNQRKVSIERVSTKKALTVARVPVRQSGQQEIYEEEMGNFEELVQDCLENGYSDSSTYSWNYEPTLAECQEWAESQVSSDYAGCVGACWSTFDACVDVNNDGNMCGDRRESCFGRCDSMYPSNG